MKKILLIIVITILAPIALNASNILTIRKIQNNIERYRNFTLTINGRIRPATYYIHEDLREKYDLFLVSDGTGEAYLYYPKNKSDKLYRFFKKKGTGNVGRINFKFSDSIYHEKDGYLYAEMTSWNFSNTNSMKTN
jgi:hypothetical protein